MAHLGQCFHCLEKDSATVACKDFPLLEFCNETCARESWEEGSYKDAHQQLYARKNLLGNYYSDVYDTAQFIDMQYKKYTNGQYFGQKFDYGEDGYRDSIDNPNVSLAKVPGSYVQQKEEYTAPRFTVSTLSSQAESLLNRETESLFVIPEYKMVRRDTTITFDIEENKKRLLKGIRGKSREIDEQDTDYLFAAFLSSMLEMINYPKEYRSLARKYNQTLSWVRLYEFKTLLYQPMSTRFSQKRNPLALEMMIEAVKHDRKSLKEFLLELARPIRVYGKRTFGLFKSEYTVYNALRISIGKVLDTARKNSTSGELTQYFLQVNRALKENV